MFNPILDSCETRLKKCTHCHMRPLEDFDIYTKRFWTESGQKWGTYYKSICRECFKKYINKRRKLKRHETKSNH